MKEVKRHLWLLKMKMYEEKNLETQHGQIFSLIATLNSISEILFAQY